MSAAESDTTARPSQQRFWRELGAVALIVALVFVVVDFALPGWERRLVVDEVADLNSPAALGAKLKYLRDFPGQRIALLGDSVVLGRVLADGGDADWRQKTLAALLTEHVAKQSSEPTAIVNLSFNGALPADLAEVGRLLEGVNPHLIVADIGLRAFSADFSAGPQAFTRPWLPRVQWTPDGSVRIWPERLTWASRQESRLDSWLARHWRAYRLRELARQTICDGELRRIVEPLRQRLIRAGGGSLAVQQSTEERENAELDLLMKARSRYQTIALNDEHAQTRGLRQLLATVQSHGWPTLVFFTWESPDVREALLDREPYAARRQELQALIQPYLSERVRFSPGLESLPADRYLDHIHIDAAGYRALVDSLQSDLDALLALPPRSAESSQPAK